MGAVKIYKHTDTGAPSITGQVGKAIALLDAVLVNGYNQVNVTSITRSSSLVTVVTAVAHGFNTYDIVQLAGATPTAYNDEFRITVINNTTFTFAIAGEPATPATGTITVKRAPAGFSKTFNGTNKAVYRSNDLSSDRRYFRILDDGTTSGGSSEFSCTGWETMASVDAGTGRWPQVNDDANGHYCRKSSSNDAVAHPWIIVSDGKTVYIFIEYGGNYLNPYGTSTPHVMAFGDSVKLRPTDAYSSFIAGSTTSNATSNVPNGLFSASTTFSTPGYASAISLNRDMNGVTLGRAAKSIGISNAGTLGSSILIRYPNDSDKSLIIGPVMIGHDDMWRANMPGIYDNMHGRVFSQGEIIENVKGYEGRKFFFQYGIQATTTASVFIDITGPWE